MLSYECQFMISLAMAETIHFLRNVYVFSIRDNIYSFHYELGVSEATEPDYIDFIRTILNRHCSKMAWQEVATICPCIHKNEV